MSRDERETTSTAAERSFGARFLATRLLKQGMGVQTFVGMDSERDTQVVIKTPSHAAEINAAWHRLEHEARILSQLDGASLTPLLHFGRDNGVPYFVRDWVVGTTLRERIQRGKIGLLEALTVARCLLEALHTAHHQEVWHLDVKPENIIVAADSCHAKLIDFGLSRSGHLDVSVRELSAGTLRYMSPEQAGLSNRAVDERSDLYSVGLVLFEMLAGRAPFEAATVSELLRMQLCQKPPSLRSLDWSVPRVLDELCERLLKKEPEQRYQSSAAVLVDLESIVGALARGESQPAVVIGAADRRESLTEPALVGRGDELAQLGRSVEQLRRGEGGLLAIAGESGSGKTRLLDEMAVRALADGIWVLRGSATDRRMQRPFEIFEGVAAEVLREARSRPALMDTMRERLGDTRRVLGALLPQLAELLQAEQTGSLGLKEHAEARAVLALSALFDVLSTPSHPALVLLDDCQWSDDVTVRALVEWQRKGAAGHTLVVPAYRAEEVATTHPLMSLSRLELRPLGARQIEEIIESMAGRLPPEATEAISRQALGNPFMATALMWGLWERGALLPSEEGWQLVPEALEQSQSSWRAAVMLSRRLHDLPERVLAVLQAGAVLGREFRLDMVSVVAGVESALVLDALRAARRRHLLWTSTGEESWRFVHDRLREALIESVEPDRRMLLHGVVAELLVERSGNDFDIAHHFDAAGMSERAWSFAMRAGRTASERHALDIAERQFRIALRGATARSASERLRVAEALGEVLTLRDRHDEATAHLEAALALCSRRIDRARVLRRLADVEFRVGDAHEASKLIGDALGLLGHRVPKSVGRIALAKELARLALSDAARQRRAALTPAPEAEIEAIELYRLLTYASMFNRGMVATGWSHLRRFNLARRYQATSELGRAYGDHAAVLAQSSFALRGTQHATAGAAICAESGDAWGAGHALHHEGMALYIASRFEQAAKQLRSAIAVLQRAGDTWEVASALAHLAYSTYRLGRLEEAAELGRQLREIGVVHDQAMARCGGLQIIALATFGRVPRGPLLEEMAVADHALRFGMVAQAEALRLLRSGEPLDAAAVLQDAWDRSRRDGVFHDLVHPAVAWLATALRVAATSLPTSKAVERRELLRRAHHAARVSSWVGRRMRNQLPHALRERGLLAAIDGRPKTASRHLDASLRIADEQGARLERAQTLLGRGEVGAVFGWPGAHDDISKAHAELAAVGADFANGRVLPRVLQSTPSSATFSLVDRFDNVLETGREIATSLSREAVLAATRQAALALLRGEQCWVVEAADDDCTELSVVVPQGEHDVSRTLVQAALAAGEPRVLEPEIDEALARAESLALSGARSALAVPIAHRGRARYCLYLTHGLVGGLFGEDEKRIATFLATLGGAALDNAWSFAELREAFERLEAAHLELKETQAQLVQAGKLAALGQIGAGIAHELNQPLQAIRGFAQRIKRRDDGTDARHTEELGIIIDATANMGRIVDNVRLFARDQPLELVPIDVRVAVEDALTLLGRQLAQRGIQLRWDRPSQPLGVRGDRARLQQVFLNLILNARDAVEELPPGQPRWIEIRVREAAREVALVVRDSGVGVGSEHESRLFEPFFTTKSAGKGTGLGLAIAYGIVREHAGELSYRRDAAGGAVFTVSLPTLPLS